MNSKPKGLGRGLNALIPDYSSEEIENNSGTELLDIRKIKPNEKQPRKYFDQEKLKSLADSIERHGLIQPILVVSDGDYYIIAAGERRYRASVLAGLKEIPVIIKEFTDQELAQIALIENIQREDLSDVEEAKGYLELRDSYSMSVEEIAEIVGKSRAAVSNTLRLLQLPDSIQDMIDKRSISAGHARAVLSLQDSELREKFAEYIADHDLSVREAEKLSKTFSDKDGKEKPPKAPKLPHLIEFEENLSKVFGTKVNIRTNEKSQKGRIEIEYYDNDDLGRILEKLSEESVEV